MSRAALVCIGATLLAATSASAADAPARKNAPPDLDFLEYLGTLESEQENWTDVVNVELPAPAKPKEPGKTQPKAEAAKRAESEK